MLRRYTVTVAGRAHAVEVEDGEGGYRVVLDGKERRLTLLGQRGPDLSWLDGTRVVHAVVDGGGPAKAAVALRGVTLPAELADARAAAPVATARAAPSGPLGVRAPIPGRVVRVLVKAGAAVAAGAALVVIEAMKMENEIRAPRAGTVAEVHCAEGATVESGQALVTLTLA